MLRTTLFTVILYFQAFDANCQSGFYKNYFNTFGSKNFRNGPRITSITPISNNCYILTTAENDQDISTACIAKLDNSFNLLWTKAFKMQNGGYFDYAIELADSSIVGLAYPDVSLGGIFYRINKFGQLLQANSYLDRLLKFSNSQAICKSSSNDTAFVTIVGQCNINYGYAKFNLDGSVLWANEYSSTNIGGSLYTLIQGIKHGYLSTFEFLELNNEGRFGGLAHVGNSGQFIRARKFILDPLNSNLSGITSLFLSKDTTYYLGGGTGKYDSTNFSRKYYYDAYLLNLDSNLLTKNCWRFSIPDKIQAIKILNFANTSGNEIIINGTITDTSSFPFQLFILKFDPTDNGKIIWCKTFHLKSGSLNKNSISAPVRGINVYNNQDDIVFPIYTGFDGSCLAGLNSSGEFLCNSSDINISVSKWNECRSTPVILTPRPAQLILSKRELEDTTINYIDSLICYSNSTAINEFQKIALGEIFFNYRIQGLNVRLFNLLNQPIKIFIFSLSGDLIFSSNLKDNSACDYTVKMPGLYLINAYSNNKVQNTKILLSEEIKK